MHGTIILIGLESKEASFHIRSMFCCKWGSIKVVLVAKCSPADITWGVLERPVPTIDPTSTMWDIGSRMVDFFFCNIFDRCVTVGWAQHVRNLKTKFPFRKWPSVLGDPVNRFETGGNLRFRRNGHQFWVVFLLKNFESFHPEAWQFDEELWIVFNWVGNVSYSHLQPISTYINVLYMLGKEMLGFGYKLSCYACLWHADGCGDPNFWRQKQCPTRNFEWFDKRKRHVW